MSWIYEILIDPYSFSQTNKENNSVEFYNFFAPRGAGYTLECISAMLGNIDAESQINPGGMETGAWYGQQSGVGLVQWTEGHILKDWCDLHGWNWYDGYAQCEKLAEELETSAGQWIPKPSQGYPYTQAEFRAMTDIDLAVEAFVYEYLRPSAQAIADTMAYRKQKAGDWYQYLSGQPVPPYPPTPPPFGDYLVGVFCNMFKELLFKRL